MPLTPATTLLGTGTMGIGMAHSLLRAGLPTTVWNRHPEKAAPLAGDGATVAETLDDAVSGADVVITMLFDLDSVAAVMAEAIPLLQPGTVWIQASTVGRAGIDRLAAMAAERGIPFYDAPVVGTKQPAEDGKLTVLAAGPTATREVVQPVFDAIGAKTVWLGDAAGAASAMKLVANSWVATITAGTAFGIEQAKAFGLDPARFLEAISGGAADSPYSRRRAARSSRAARTTRSSRSMGSARTSPSSARRTSPPGCRRRSSTRCSSPTGPPRSAATAVRTSPRSPRRSPRTTRSDRC